MASYRPQQHHANGPSKIKWYFQQFLYFFLKWSIKSYHSARSWTAVIQRYIKGGRCSCAETEMVNTGHWGREYARTGIHSSAFVEDRYFVRNGTVVVLILIALDVKVDRWSLDVVIADQSLITCEAIEWVNLFNWKLDALFVSRVEYQFDRIQRRSRKRRCRVCHPVLWSNKIPAKCIRRVTIRRNWSA